MQAGKEVVSFQEKSFKKTITTFVLTGTFDASTVGATVLEAKSSFSLFPVVEL
jgi:hypothetical protein